MLFPRLFEVNSKKQPEKKVQDVPAATERSDKAIRREF